MVEVVLQFLVTLEVPSIVVVGLWHREQLSQDLSVVCTNLQYKCVI